MNRHWHRSEWIQSWREIGAEKGFYVPVVCEQWRGSSQYDQEFANFIADVGLPIGDKVCLVRKDRAADFCPDNMIWITRGENYKMFEGGEAEDWRGFAPKAMVEAYDKRTREEALKIARMIKI